MIMTGNKRDYDKTNEMRQTRSETIEGGLKTT